MSKNQTQNQNTETKQLKVIYLFRTFIILDRY